MKRLIATLMFCAVTATMVTAAHAACVADDKEYAEGHVLWKPDGSGVRCQGKTWVSAKLERPYIVRRAELRSFDDPSQHPRCNAKKTIQRICGSEDICRFDVLATLCGDSDVAEYTTHMEIEWRCRTHSKWRYGRVERGEEIIFDCRGS